MAEETVPAAPLDLPQGETAPVVAAAPEPAVAATEANPAPEPDAAPAAEPAAGEAETAASGEAAPAEAALTEAKPEGDGTEVKAEPDKPAAPSYADLKMPDGVVSDPIVMGAFTGVLGEFGVAPEAGQKLLDLHANVMTQAVEAMAQHQQDVFSETRRTWIAEFDKSAGNRRDTILNDAKWAISDIVKDTKQRQALWDVLAFTGAGDHPAVINAFASVAKRLRERAAPAPGLPQNGAKSGSPADRRYGRQP